MSSTFADLGVSKAVAGALRARGIETPVRRPVARHPRRARRPRRARQVAHRLGQDARVRRAAGRPRRRRTAPGRPPSCSRRRASSPSQIVDELAGVVQRPRALGSPPSTAASASTRRPSRPRARRRARRHARPAARPDRARRRLARRDRGARARRGRPDARHGLPPVVDRIVRDDAATTARRCSSPRRSTGEVDRIAAAYTRDAAATSTRRRRERDRHTSTTASHRVAHEAKVSALVHELGDPQRGLTLVFVRTKRGADRLVKRLATQTCTRSRCTATSRSRSARRRSPASSPAASTRSSRPTSRRAASTSAASPT